LLLIGSVTLLWNRSSAFEPAAQKAWYDQPQPRQETLIRYQPVAELTPLPLTRISSTEIDAGPLAANSAAAWSSGGHARTFLLGGNLLLGRATVRLTRTPRAHSPTLLIQLKKNGAEFHTVATAEAVSAEEVTLTFPGEEATAVRLLVSGEAGDPDPVALFEVAQIELASTPRIMLLGDSITAGKYADDTIGYRKVLYDQLTAGGVPVDFVGGYGDSPYEGHFQGGRKIYDFYPNNGIRTPQLDVTSDMDNYRPSIVTIFLGTNNLNDLAGAPAGPYGTPSSFNTTPAGQMASLIAYLLKWRNGTRGSDLQNIFVCLISPIKRGDSLVAVYNIEIARVAREYADGTITGTAEPVHIIDCYTPFYEDPVFNNDKVTNYSPYLSTSLDPANVLHPNTAGHQLIGSACYKALNPVLSGAQLWFTDHSWESNSAGFDAEYGGQGVAVADADGDGRLDLYTTRTVSETPFRRDFFMHKSASGSYSEAAESWGIKDSGDSRGLLFVDIDSDGDLDLINGNSPGRNRLYENLARTTFQEITATAGLDNLSSVTTALLAFDADRDEDLDLYAVNSRTANELYLNQGNGHFQRADRGANDVEEPAIASESGAAADFDNDGDPDIYIVKRGAPNKLFVNNGSGYFSEGAAAAGLALNHNSKSAVWADLDNDADLDLLVSVTASASDANPLLRAYKNNGTGLFQEITTTLNIPMNGASALTGDFDLDGDLDIITTSESGSGAFYRNNGNWQFGKVSATGAEVAAGDVRSGAVYDYDGDGDLDFYLTRSDIFNVLRENTLSTANHFLLVNPAGPGGNASAIGTKIWVYQAGRAGDPSALLGYREVLSGCGHLAQYPLIQHFGLGSRTSCDMLVQFIDNTFLLLRESGVDNTLSVSPQPLAGTGNPAARLSIFSGQNQSAAVGAQLPLPLTVKAVDSAGSAVAGLHVDFSVLSGDAAILLPAGASSSDLWLEAESGSLGGSLAWVYDAACSGNGQVFVPPQGRGNGRDTLAFTIPAATAASLWLRAHTGTSGSSLTAAFNGGTPYSQTINTAGSWQWTRIGSAGGWNLAAGSHKLLLDIAPGTLQIDRILLSSTPSYTPSGMGEGNGQDPFATDSQGLAARTVQLGTTAGTLIFQARAIEEGKTLTADFKATAKAAAPATLTMTSGNNQTASQSGIPLTEPLVVTLRDAFGNPTPGETVLFSVRSGGGTLSPADGRATTDSLGEARMVLIPGAIAGSQTVAANAPSISGSEVIFSVTLVNGAANLVYLQGDAQSDTVHAVLPLPVRFKVTRSDNQPVASYPVTLTALNGGRIAKTASVGADSVLQLLTGNDGTLSLYWRLGTTAGEQGLKVEAPGLQGSPRILKAVASHALPYRLLAIAGDAQTGVVASKLPHPLTARIADRYGNPIPGHPLQFRVLAGGGKLNGAGQSMYSTTTDLSGSAAVQLTLGTFSGENANQVEVTSQFNSRSLSGSPLIFYASAKAGPPAFIFALSGNQQSGTAGTLLPDSLTVAVKDFYQNSVTSLTVTFSVTMGDGKVNGVSQALVATDGRGLASVQYRLGTQAGAELHRVTAKAQGLSSETALFSASATADAAAQISYYSGNNQSGLTKGILADPFVVLVRDRYNNPVQNHPVVFSVTAGGGTFSGENPVSITTETDGLARVWLTLGESTGDSTHRATATSTVKNGTTPLNGSPIRFYANGVPVQAGDIQSVQLISGDGQSGTVNQWLANPLRARVLDSFGAPAAQHTVQFRIARGSGVLGSGQDTLVNLKTSSSGIVETTWRLGITAGDSTQAVQLICLNKSGLPVGGSHRYIHATARPGAPEISRSTLTADSPLPADGISESLVTATIRDAFGNPIPDQGIVLVSSGLSAVVQPNQGYSGSDGIFQARARSTEAGTLTLQARVATSLQWLTAARTIDFVQPPAARLDLSGGDQQSATVGTWLPVPLSVRVLDGYGNGLAGEAVRFSLVEGNAELSEADAAQAASSGSGAIAAAVVTIPSEATGLAAVRVKAGTRSGRLVIVAALSDSPDNYIRFHAFATPGAAADLVKLSGDAQSGTTWHRLNQPLVVQVLDGYANGVPGQIVTFSTPQPDGSFSPQAGRSTDSTGTAAILWYLGSQEGSQSALATVAGVAHSPLSFTATAVANQAPQLALPDSLLLNENDIWHLSIEVHDLEGDSIDIALVSAPEGLVLNGSGEIAWQPSYDQAGRHALRIRAADHFGAAMEAASILVVKDVNRPPYIDPDSCVPQQQNDLTLKKPEAIDFVVSVSDPDGDALNYSWYLNDAFCAYGKPSYRLQSELISSGEVQVKVVISDRKNSVSRIWSLKLVAAVWLAEFRAKADPGRGIHLSWQTLLETDNLGFCLQRAISATGPYQTLTTLPAAAKGHYEYLDASAQTGVRYYYRLQDLSRDGSVQDHPLLQAQLPLPYEFALSANYPNPFNGATRMTLALPKQGELQVEIIDLLGRHVRTLYQGAAKGGYIELTWDSRDDLGRDAASGIYYCRVIAGEEMAYRKMVLVK
jgi:adhesin/invasin